MQDALSQGDYGRILTAIKNVGDHIERSEIKLPQLVVFGDESDGKSSVMEAICNVPFPRGGQLKTRAVMNVRLRRGPKQIKVWSTYKDSTLPRNVHLVKNEEELNDVISRRQDFEFEQQNAELSEEERSKLVENPISVEIWDQDNPDLTLVNSPGFLMNKASDESQDPSADIKFMKEVLLQYLEDPSSILLIVMAADSNIKTVNVLNFMRDFEETISPDDKENLRKRTIYCLTKVRMNNPRLHFGLVDQHYWNHIEM